MYQSFADELVKIAKKDSHGWMVPAGIAGGTLLGATAFALAKPGIRRAIGHQLSSMARGLTGRQLAKKVTTPNPDIDVYGKQVADQIRSSGLDPSKITIGLSGIPGSGKSTVAKSISKHLGTNVVTEDLHGMSDVIKVTTGKKPIQPGHLYEQTHLLHRVEPDKFDVMIHVDVPVAEATKRLHARGRGAWQSDVYDLDKMQKTISTAFNETAGAAKEVAPGIKMKIKPPGGFKADETLNAGLKNKGIDPSHMSRQQKVVTQATGNKHYRKGRLAFLKPSTVGQAAAGVLGGATLGGTGAYIYKKHKER